MFIHEVETDMFDKNQVHYWLTQGDSCGIVSTPKDNEGNIVSSNLISQVKFKITAPCTNVIVFEKEMAPYNNTSYLFRLLSSESKKIALGRYNYEIEYTLEDGNVNTPNQWKFEIIPQGVSEV